jgi:hypothetical protein
MEPEGSLPYSQERATELYHELDDISLLRTEYINKKDNVIVKIVFKCIILPILNTTGAFGYERGAAREFKR